MKPNIYTGVGDKGNSNLIVKKSLSKSDLVFEVLGTLDELSAFLGFLHLSKISELSKIAIDIQSDLLSIGSFVAGAKLGKNEYDYWIKKVTLTEQRIDYFESKNTVIKNFIIPGGCIESNYLHISRAVSRRLERVFIRYLNLSKRTDIKIIEPYLNRLSDLLFSMSRYSNKKRGYKDYIWKASLSLKSSK